jgi:hypothetical protein
MEGIEMTDTMTDYEYIRRNRDAMMLLFDSDTEYIACRCGLLRGHFPLLILASLAIEKYLKAYLLLKDPSQYPLARLKRKFGHKIPDLLKEAEKYEPGFSHFCKTAAKWKANFEARYPDNADAAKNMSSSELKDIDEFVFFLYAHLPMSDTVKTRTKLFSTLLKSEPSGFYREDLLQNNAPFQRYVQGMSLSRG